MHSRSVVHSEAVLCILKQRCAFSSSVVHSCSVVHSEADDKLGLRSSVVCAF